MILLCSSTVLAATVTQNVTVNVVEAESTDIAYIYKKAFRVDHNIIDVFNELGFNVTLINEKTLPTDLSRYRLVFVGDENLLNRNSQNLNNYPLIIINHYDGKDLGLADRDGVSQLGSTSPLRVAINGDHIQVYTRAFKEKRISIPYYFLDLKNKAPGLIQIAGTQTTSAGRKFGDVISYANPGTQLKNGRIQNERLCFFGIVESDYWTKPARNMFKECVEFVAG